MDKSIEFAWKHAMESLDSKCMKVGHDLHLKICVNASVYTAVNDLLCVCFSKKFINRCIPEKSSYQVNSFFSKTGISEFFQVTHDSRYITIPSTTITRQFLPYLTGSL